MLNNPVYLINLDRSPDRLASVQQRAAELGLEFIRVSGVDGAVDKLQPVLQHRYYRPLTPAEVGCYSSHIKTLEEFLKTDYNYAIILEDDGVLSPEFSCFAEAAISNNQQTEIWDVLKLHGKKKGIIHSIALADCNLVDYCTVPLSTRGTIWTREGCQKMLRYFEGQGVKRPIDVDLRYTWETGLRILVLNPAVVKASGSLSTISDRRVLYHQQSRFRQITTKLRYEFSFVARNFQHLVKRYGLIRAMISQLGIDRPQH